MHRGERVHQAGQQVLFLQQRNRVIVGEGSFQLQRAKAFKDLDWRRRHMETDLDRADVPQLAQCARVIVPGLGIMRLQPGIARGSLRLQLQAFRAFVLGRVTCQQRRDGGVRRHVLQAQDVVLPEIVEPDPACPESIKVAKAVAAIIERSFRVAGW
jgi:hypothetical protein